MTYHPRYYDESYLFEEITIKGKLLRHVADENKTTRNTIYSYVKKFNILSEEYAQDLDVYQKIQKLRKEWYAKNTATQELPPVEKRITESGHAHRVIERYVPSKWSVKHKEINQIIETDYDWTEEDYKALEDMFVEPIIKGADYDALPEA